MTAAAGMTLLVLCSAQSRGLEEPGQEGSFCLVDRIGEGLVTDLDFSPDGKLIAASGQGLAVYSSRTGERIVYLSQPWVHEVAWSPRGDLIAIACRENETDQSSTGVVQLLESTWLTLQTVQTLREPNVSTSVSFSPSGDLIATTGTSTQTGNRSISIWNVSRGDVQQSLRWGIEAAAKIIRWSPDGSAIASILEGPNGRNGLWIWSLSASTVQAARDLGGSAIDLEWSPDGSALAISLSNGQEITFLDASTMLPAGSVKSDEYMDIPPYAAGRPIPLSPAKIAWSREGSLLAGTFENGAVKIWNISTSGLVARSRVPGGRGLSFSPTEDKLVTGAGTGIDIWDYQTNQHIQSAANSPFTTAAWSKTADAVYCSTDDNRIVEITGLRSRLELPVVKTIIQPEGKTLKAISVSEDERYLGAFWELLVQVWDLSTNPPQLSGSHSSGADCAAFSPEEDRLAWGSGERLMAMDIASNTTITMAFDPGSRVLDLDWLGDEVIVSGHEMEDGSGEIALWDARNGTMLGRIRNEKGPVWGVAPSPIPGSQDSKNRMVAVLCGPYGLWYYWGGLRVFDSSWQVVYDDPLEGASIFSWPSLSWSPDGQVLAVTHYRGRDYTYPPPTTSPYSTLLYSTKTWNVTQSLDGIAPSWLDDDILLTIEGPPWVGREALLIWARISEPNLGCLAAGVFAILCVFRGRLGARCLHV